MLISEFMKKLATALFLVAAIPTVSFAQTIAQWTFETSIPAGAPGAGVWITNIAAEVGSGTASGFHAGAATYSNPAGNGSVESFSVNTWTVGDFFQFAVSTIGLNDIGVSFDQTSSGTGPGQFNFEYSTDGISFTQFGSTYTVLPNAAPNPVWNSTTSSSLYSFAFDLSSVTAVDNQATVYFRLTDASTTSAGGGTVAAGGTDRVDNLAVVVVPEPSTVVLASIGGLLLINFMRRRP